MSTSKITKELAANYAKLYTANGGDSFAATLVLFPGETDTALLMSHMMPRDPLVQEALGALTTNEDDALLPTKNMFSRKIWQKLDTAENVDEYQKLAKLYAEVRGFIEKPSNTQTVTVVVPKCIEIPKASSDEEWEKQAAKQQAALMKHSRDPT